MNPEITKIIEQYLSGELSANDTKAFEERLSQNKELQDELNLQKSIHEAAKRSALRTEVQSVSKNYHFLKKLKWGGIGLGILLAVAATTIYLSTSNSASKSFSLNAASELTEQLKKNAPINNLNSEFFAWNANDTAFLSKEGVLVSVPDNAFLLNGKPYRESAVLQWQEALDGATIVKSGLSTTSDGKLLETQGMFSFSAKTPDGKQLTINPKVGVYVQVPVDEFKEGMKLFDGEKDASGMINWVKPRELEKIPLSVSMSDLDFYPSEYEPKLNELKARKDKKYRDSLYLSFEESVQAIPQQPSPKVNGKALFMAKCITCHMVDKDGTAPKLRNVRKKWSHAGAKPESIYTWVRDWEKAVIEDNYAREVSKWSPTASIKLPELSDEQIDAIFDYVDSSNPNESFVSLDAISSFSHIPPSSVLAFWKPKFNNTILATREFEARMKEVHNTCDKSVLDIYVKNLDKPMHELDKRIAEKGYSQFNEFANQRVGGLNSNSSHLKGLEQFYNKAVEQLKQQEATLRNKENNRRENWGKSVNSERQKEVVRSSKREAEVFNQEYTLNHKNVRKQLGRVLGATIYGNSPICNIDRFVMQTTLARKTGEYYDPVTGKTARIQYNEFSFEVADNTKYKQLYAYLFPHELNSYHRLNGKDGKFSFPLNEAILYDLAIVGISEDGYSYLQRITLKGGELGELQLDRVSENKIDASIRQLNEQRGVKTFDVKQELNWLKKEQKNYVEMKKRKLDREFRDELRSKIFPCASEELVADSTMIALPF
jgi:mono/diheme cytochrome c family protein